MSLEACLPLSELPPLEPRLQRRYQQLVKEHAHVSPRVAAGLSALAGPGTKNLAPLSGSAPGGLDNPSGLLGSRVLPDGCEHCWASLGTAERAGAAELS